ncbi:MAG: OmpA family protein [Steroidobacteraceae bacterium]
MASKKSKKSVALPPANKLTFFFERGSAKLRDQELPKLSSLARLMRRNPDALLMIRGYTVGRGSDDYNKRLGARRAHAVASALAQLGIKKERIITSSSANKRAFEQLQKIELKRRRRAEAALMDGTAATMHVPPLLAQVWLRQQSARAIAA